MFCPDLQQVIYSLTFPGMLIGCAFPARPICAIDHDQEIELFVLEKDKIIRRVMLPGERSMSMYLSTCEDPQHNTMAVVDGKKRWLNIISNQGEKHL